MNENLRQLVDALCRRIAPTPHEIEQAMELAYKVGYADGGMAKATAMKPPVDPYAFERLRVFAQELQRRIARATELCEDRMDIDGNGNPDFAMRVAQILKDNDPC